MSCATIAFAIWLFVADPTKSAVLILPSFYTSIRATSILAAAVFRLDYKASLRPAIAVTKARAKLCIPDQHIAASSFDIS